MTRDEAIHKALKVLNCLNNGRVYETAWVKGAINACEEALEQPAEPRLVSYAPDGSTCTLNIDGEEVYFNREQPAQEPVGVVSWHEGAVMGSIFPSSNMPKDGDKLYTHPHQWQELTDDEIAYIVNDTDTLFDLEDFARTIEQALKEKNHVQ